MVEKLIIITSSLDFKKNSIIYSILVYRIVYRIRLGHPIKCDMISYIFEVVVYYKISMMKMIGLELSSAFKRIHHPIAPI